MKQWWLVIALLLSLGANIGILASRAFQPQPEAPDPAAPSRPDAPPEAPAPPGEDRMPPVVHRMADELGLEGEKRDAFVEIQRAFFQQTIDARSRMARLQRQVRHEVTSEDPDRETLDELLNQLSAAHTDLERAFVNNLLDSRELLDPEQQRRFMRFLRRLRHVRADVEQRFRQRWRGRGEPWQRPPGMQGPSGPGGPGPGGPDPGGPPPQRNRPTERG